MLGSVSLVTGLTVTTSRTNRCSQLAAAGSSVVGSVRRGARSGLFSTSQESQSATPSVADKQDDGVTSLAGDYQRPAHQRLADAPSRPIGRHHKGTKEQGRASANDDRRQDDRTHQSISQRGDQGARQPDDEPPRTVGPDHPEQQSEVAGAGRERRRQPAIDIVAARKRFEVARRIFHDRRRVIPAMSIADNVARAV